MRFDVTVCLYKRRAMLSAINLLHGRQFIVDDTQRYLIDPQAKC